MCDVVVDYELLLEVSPRKYLPGVKLIIYFQIECPSHVLSSFTNR